MELLSEGQKRIDLGGGKRALKKFSRKPRSFKGFEEAVQTADLTTS